MPTALVALALLALVVALASGVRSVAVRRARRRQRQALDGPELSHVHHRQRLLARNLGPSKRTRVDLPLGGGASGHRAARQLLDRTAA